MTPAATSSRSSCSSRDSASARSRLSSSMRERSGELDDPSKLECLAPDAEVGGSVGDRDHHASSSSPSGSGALAARETSAASLVTIRADSSALMPYSLRALFVHAERGDRDRVAGARVVLTSSPARAGGPPSTSTSSPVGRLDHQLSNVSRSSSRLAELQRVAALDHAGDGVAHLRRPGQVVAVVRPLRRG